MWMDFYGRYCICMLQLYFYLASSVREKKSLTTVTKGTCFTISMYLVVPCPIEFNFEFNAKAV